MKFNRRLNKKIIFDRAVYSYDNRVKLSNFINQVQNAFTLYHTSIHSAWFTLCWYKQKQWRDEQTFYFESCITRINLVTSSGNLFFSENVILRHSKYNGIQLELEFQLWLVYIQHAVHFFALHWKLGHVLSFPLSIYGGL